MSTPYSASAAVTCEHANSSSRGSSRRSPSTSVTCAPRDWKACAISVPTTPPPAITSRAGISLAVVASRLVQASMPSSPGIGGSAGTVPPARTTARGAPSSPAPPRPPRSPPRRPTPRSRVARLERLVPAAPPALAGQAADAAEQRDPAVLEPRQLYRVVEVVDHLVA